MLILKRVLTWCSMSKDGFSIPEKMHTTKHVIINLTVHTYIQSPYHQRCSGAVDHSWSMILLDHPPRFSTHVNHGLFAKFNLILMWHTILLPLSKIMTQFVMQSEPWLFWSVSPLITCIFPNSFELFPLQLSLSVHRLLRHLSLCFCLYAFDLYVDVCLSVCGLLLIFFSLLSCIPSCLPIYPSTA